MKRAIAAHDLSGVGIASLTAAMPMLANMGVLVHPLPTAVLSSVTTFKGFVVTDLTEQMDKTVDHWKEQNFNFDYIYSGWLGSPKQVDIIIKAINYFPKAEVIVDPAFADNGKMYPTMGEESLLAMRRLVARADIITPNVTEAMFLLGKEAFPKAEGEVTQWAKDLCGMGAKIALITGVDIGERSFVAVCDNRSGSAIYNTVPFKRINMPLHGTGDIFTSALLGRIAAGDSILDATDFATKYMNRLIDITLAEAARCNSAEERKEFMNLGLAIQLTYNPLKLE